MGLNHHRELRHLLLTSLHSSRQCLEKVRAIQEGTGASNISFQIQFGDLTNAEALDTITAFAGDRGLEKLHSIPADPPDWLIEDAYAASAPAAVAR